jgi:hypothetical protein
MNANTLKSPYIIGLFIAGLSFTLMAILLLSELTLRLQAANTMKELKKECIALDSMISMSMCLRSIEPSTFIEIPKEPDTREYEFGPGESYKYELNIDGQIKNEIEI